jgi:hypothetical protein
LSEAEARISELTAERDQLKETLKQMGANDMLAVLRNEAALVQALEAARACQAETEEAVKQGNQKVVVLRSARHYSRFKTSFRFFPGSRLCGFDFKHSFGRDQRLIERYIGISW